MTDEVKSKAELEAEIKKTSKAAPAKAGLSDEAKAKIEAEVKAELEAETQKQLEADYKASVKSAAKKKMLFSDADGKATGKGLIPLFIDLPSVSECIRIDGTCYYPGRTYNVLPEVADTLNEIMGRGQAHEDEISGRKDSNAMRNRRNAVARLS